MFGGADLGQLRLVLGILVVIFGSASILALFDTTTSPAALGEEHIIRHQTGMLIQSYNPGDEPPAQQGILAPGGLVEMNSADATTLMALPGIGPARAQAILDERDRGGAFRDLADLERVPGIGPKTVQRLSTYITIEGGDQAEQTDPAPPPSEAAPQGLHGGHNSDHVRVNHADATELQRLTRVGPVMAQRILEDRQRHGPYRHPEDMLRVSGIGPAFVEANRDVLVFD
ncbi:MAG: ComEA family DNA-binding protein [Candidatus Sumerlaeia bacterium]|nr:ComEA family DNA-binding protein [Candidatus Sumerlaeia bacterium]